MSFRITVVGDPGTKGYENLVSGACLKLEFGADADDITATLNGDRVGYVASTPQAIIGRTSSASWLTNLIQKGEASGKKVSEVWAFLTESKPLYLKPGIETKRFCAELFFVRDHAAVTTSTDPVYKVAVGGVNAKNGGKVTVIADLTKGQQDGNPAIFDMVVKSTGKDGVFTYRMYRPGDNNPAGELLLEDPAVAPELEKWFRNHEELTVKTTGVLFHKQTPKGNPVGTTGYEVEVKFATVDDAEFDNEIDEAIRHGAGQDNEIREKVQYLISANVAKPVVRLCLKSMKPVCGVDIPKKPDRPYSSRSDILGDALSYSILGEHIRLIGDKGSGKNTLIQTICWLRNQPMTRIQGNVQMDKMDLLGSYQLLEGKTIFELSDVMKALRAGKTVVIDEANLIRPDVLGLMHSATDEARSILIPGYGLLTLGKDAQVVYTMNEGYQGTSDMNEATVDRTPTFELGQEVSLSTLLSEFDPKLVKICQKVSDEIRKGVEEGQLGPDAITIRGYISACKQAEYVSLRRALVYCVANKIQEISQRTAVVGIIANNCA